MRRALLVGEQPTNLVAYRQTAVTTPWVFIHWRNANKNTGSASLASGAPQADDAFRAHLREVDAVIGGWVAGEWSAGCQLRLYQLPFTGAEVVRPEQLPSSCRVCNTHASSSIAEYVLCGMLDLEIGLSRTDKQFRTNGWPALVGRGPLHRELRGQTLGLVGYGAIGQAVAQRAAAFDMRVIAVSRRGGRATSPLSWHGDVSRLDELLSESDFVVIAVPSNASTVTLIDPHKIARMQASAVIINVSRGRDRRRGSTLPGADEWKDPRRNPGRLVSISPSGATRRSPVAVSLLGTRKRPDDTALFGGCSCRTRAPIENCSREFGST